MKFLAKLTQLRAYSTVLPRGKVLLQDDMSVTHGQLLETTLASHLPKTETALHQGHTVPCGSHLLYFNHAVAEPALGADGYDNMQAPQGSETPFLRRWIGGSVTFNLSTPLKLGSPAFCEETVTQAEDTSKTKSTEKISVTIERAIQQSPADNWSIKEYRTLLYLTASERLKHSMSRVSGSVQLPEEPPLVSHKVKVTDLLLFRYSALTFNAHKIHYDTKYAESEGLATPVAHGPLLLTLVLRWIEAGLLPPGFAVYQIAYKIVDSVKANEEIELRIYQSPESKTHFRAVIVGETATVFDAELELSRKPAN